MKKFFIMGMAAMGLALTACNNDETVEVAKGNAIGFNTFVNNSTRATDMITANLDNFKVWGMMNKGEQTGKPFEGVVVTKADGKWSYGTPVYWEKDYAYSFVAVSPADAFTMTTAPAAYKDYGTITFDNDAKAGKTDLLYAAKDNGVVTIPENACPAAVNMTFNHMLSRVRFQFKNGMDDGSTLTVTNVQINDAYKSGTAVLKETFTDFAWTTDEATGVLTFDNATVTNFAQAAACVSGHKYMIPATKAYSVTFKVTRDHNGVTDSYNHIVTLPETAMKPGMSYQFTAEFTAENINPDQVLCPITFSAEVNPWIDGEFDTNNKDYNLK